MRKVIKKNTYIKYIFKQKKKPSYVGGKRSRMCYPQSHARTNM